jgi:prepilin-type processing-associated H-X9-DG protein
VGNFNQLQLCWHLYANDNDDKLVPNKATGTAYDRAQVWADSRAWLQGNAYTDVDTTNIASGRLYAYNKQPEIYKCPGDKSTVMDQGQIPRSRSVSMNVYMNWDDAPGNTYFNYCWHKMSSIGNPGPSRAFVFVEEHQDSISQSGFFVNHPNKLNIFGSMTWTWITFPATRHGNGCTVSFADGHVESWHFKEAATTGVAGMGPWLFLKPTLPNNRDMVKFMQGLPVQVPF